MYSKNGRPSIPPETLLGAQVLMALYSIRSARAFCERLEYDLLFRWFLDMTADERAFNASTFSKNVDRLLESRVAEEFFAGVVELARDGGWASNEHFSADGTLIESWASLKSFRPKDEDPGDYNDGNGWADFKGQQRKNDTHQSRTDPEARLYRKGKGQEARLYFGAHALMENRNGLCVAIKVTSATETTEGEVALSQVEALDHKKYKVKSVGADKNYHNKAFVSGCRKLGVAPHTAQVKGRKVAGLDNRTTRRPAYQASQKVRKRVESIFGWMKTTGSMRRSRHRGIERTNLQTTITATAYNLVRLAKLRLST